MLNIEKIENIIKSKYAKYSLSSFSNNCEFIFGERKIPNDCLYKQKIISYEYSSNELEFIDREIIKEDDNFEYVNKRFTIENNAIELKHLLNIEITQQDIIDWIKTFNTCVEIQLGYNIFKNFYIAERITLLCFYVYNEKDKSNTPIFSADNSNEYWRLYNIIKNLKE